MSKRSTSSKPPQPKVTLYRGRYYCDSCLVDVVKDPADRARYGLPPLIKKKGAASQDAPR